jgi:hypothetical protein
LVQNRRNREQAQNEAASKVAGAHPNILEMASAWEGSLKTFSRTKELESAVEKR